MSIQRRLSDVFVIVGQRIKAMYHTSLLIRDITSLIKSARGDVNAGAFYVMTMRSN